MVLKLYVDHVFSVAMISKPLVLYGAPVAELVDAADSKSVVRKDVGVRVSLGAPNLFPNSKTRQFANPLTVKKFFVSHDTQES